jgi:hypothetical protein
MQLEPSRFMVAPVAATRRRQRPRLSWRRLSIAAFGALLVLLGAFIMLKDRYGDRMAELSRALIGDENTARLEKWYFAVQDRIDLTSYSLFGADTDPFADTPEAEAAAVVALEPALNETTPAPAAPPRPAPLALPEVRPLRGDPREGEGVWTTAGLPRSSPEDVLMAKTFVRPDLARPYALVGVLLVDRRRVRLHVTGGTESPGGDRGVKGPGVIPPAHRGVLLAAWNGGFRGPHGGYGMYADGRQYRPLRNGFASLVLTRDGAVRIGQWGRDVFWSDDIEAVRQNAVLLVDNCEVSRRTNEGNDTWGYVQVNSAEFITWRSAVGVTRDGNILVAAGNSLSAATLAKALWAAGACYAMQLDINTPYVLTSLFVSQPDGSLKASKFMESMIDNPSRFLGTQANDFMYLTLDETNYKP